MRTEDAQRTGCTRHHCSLRSCCSAAAADRLRSAGTMAVLYRTLCCTPHRATHQDRCVTVCPRSPTHCHDALLCAASARPPEAIERAAHRDARIAAAPTHRSGRACCRRCPRSLLLSPLTGCTADGTAERGTLQQHTRPAAPQLRGRSRCGQCIGPAVFAAVTQRSDARLSASSRTPEQRHHRIQRVQTQTQDQICRSDRLQLSV